MEDELKSLLDELAARIAASNQHCALCDNRVLEMARYPHYLCNTCEEEAVDKEGRLVSFTEELDGYSLEMRFRDGLSPNVIFNPARDDGYPHVWVKGTKCEVQVAHFGGIVMIPAL
jgi:hypothetical protein